MKASTLKNKLIKWEKFSLNRPGGHTITIEPDSNIWGTRFYIEVSYFETGDRFPHYSYSYTDYTKDGVISRTVEDLLKRRIVF